MKKRGVLFFSVLFSFAVLLPQAEAVLRFTDNQDIPLWAEAPIEIVQSEGIMTGFGDGSFRPNRSLNRAEALVLLLRTKKIDFGTSSRTSKVAFSDVPRGEWFSGAVQVAVDNGWINGFMDGTFGPARAINRAEWATLVSRVFELSRVGELDFSDVPSQVWFSESVSHLVANDLIREKGTLYHPDTEVSRADAAWTISEILQKPRLMGESGTNILIEGSYRDTRRVAIKPKDFNPNKQGYDVEKKQLKITAVPREETVVLNSNSDFADLGTLRIANNLDDRVQLHSLEFKLRFEKTNIGPAENFYLSLTGGGVSREQIASRTGSIFIGGLNLLIPAGEERVFRVKLKPDASKAFYPNGGNGELSIFLSDGSMISTFAKETASRNGTYRTAPVGFEERKLAPIQFIP
ncbi:S-layer homology domain-containing protein [Candidatus Gracilibacteria bacterium]|nr:S-layer homology domain-containing protein [Candidatus Gracilibacteria bacterium]